jgi:DNA-binding NarL/FixJ family response regulator
MQSDSVAAGGVMTRILIADDNPRIRSALRNLLEQDEDWKVCAEANDGGEAVQRAKETSPDLVVMDFQMPVMDGLQAAREISRVIPKVPVLLCTAHLSHMLIGEAQRIGIPGAVSKSSASDIVNGIKALLRHESFYRQPA